MAICARKRKGLPSNLENSWTGLWYRGLNCHCIFGYRSLYPNDAIIDKSSDGLRSGRTYPWSFFLFFYISPALLLGLTGAQGGGRDLDLAGGLVGLEGWGSAASAEVRCKQVRALGPRGAGAGSIAPMMGLLFVIHGYQLEGGRENRCWEMLLCVGQNTSCEKSTGSIATHLTQKYSEVD